MNILIAGIGAIGSNLTARLVSDLRGHIITVLDRDTVEERNTVAGTQFYMPSQVGLSKIEALQFNIYKQFQKEIEILSVNINKTFYSAGSYGLIIDCFDNYNARSALQKIAIQEKIELLHMGFSDTFTFAIEWAENYTVPSDITSGFDICEMQGASSFVNMVASIGGSVVQEFLTNKSKINIVGNRLSFKRIA